jgi:anti-anti-sigma regulatory factor
MHIATIRQQGTEEIIVWGDVSHKECQDLVECGSEVLGGEAATIILDLRSASFCSSEFVGAVAEIAMKARALAKEFTVRACGRTADWLAWSGLQKVLRLDVFSGPKVPAGRSWPECDGDDLP